MKNKSYSLIKTLKKESPGEYVFKRLTGLLCLYKPPDMDLAEIENKLKYVFNRGINEMPCRPAEKIVKIDGSTSDARKSALIVDNLADTVEAIGPRYVRRNFLIDFLHPLHKNDSGILGGSFFSF